jgi:hypothetical protein
MSGSTPPFYYLNGAMTFPQPFDEKGSTMMSFMFKSDIQCLQKICDQWLNTPSNNELYYQPLAPIVQITFADTKQSRPSSEPYHDWGIIPYQEVIVTMFVVRLSKLGPVWVAEHISALVPYIFVTDAIVMANGREVYGMPKALGWVDLPKSVQESPKNFQLETVGAPYFMKGVPFSKNLLLSIVQTSEQDIPITEEWKDLSSAAAAIKKLMFGEGHLEIPGIELLIEIAKIWADEELPFTSLRQVRSISAPGEAVYQAIVEFNAKSLKVNGGGLINGSFQLKLPHNDLFPIAADFGLSDGQMAEAAFWLDWDFLFDTGKEIWNAQQQQQPGFWNKLTQFMGFK